MGRRRKYKNLKVFSASVEAETLNKIDQLRGRLSRGEFIDILVTQRGDIAQVVAENKVLKRENAELKAYISKLEQRIEELESKLRTTAKTKKKPKVSDKVLNAIERLFANSNEVKVLDLMRALGYTETGEALIRKAEMFINANFDDDGDIFISEDLGLILEPVEGLGILAGKVKRLEK